MNLFDEGPPLVRERLPLAAQKTLLARCREIVTAAPLFVPSLPGGASFHLHMTSAGDVGWLSDSAGYRYATAHPLTGRPWPPISIEFLEIAKRHGLAAPDSLLLNVYKPGDSLGMHADLTEEDLTLPVVSISLGDSCIFVVNDVNREGGKEKLRLVSGDVVVLDGERRLAYHGVPKIYRQSAPPELEMRADVRINVTLRRARLMSERSDPMLPSQQSAQQFMVTAPDVPLMVTGHRPNKLGGYRDSPIQQWVRKKLREVLRVRRPPFVISGMALGVDTWWAEAAMQEGIPFHAYLPFRGQESRWPPSSQTHYRELLKAAAQVLVIEEGGYESWKMQSRNEAMVRDCGAAIAVWNGSAGGTGNAVRAMIEAGRPWFRIDPSRAKVL